MWVLSPFIYRKVCYLLMQSVYEPDGAKGGDAMVISKYRGGRFVNQDTTGTMEDICYFKRFGVNR